MLFLSHEIQKYISDDTYTKLKYTITANIYTNLASSLSKIIKYTNNSLQTK